MATPSLSVGGEFAEYAHDLVASGRFANTAEVLQAALDALRREECDDEAKRAYLEQALEDGEASGVFEGDPFESLRIEMGWESKI
jgi:putative addiction module CopG family antidote